MNETKRLGYIDMARGFAMLLVVLGHIWDNPLNVFITSFHVPIFFFLSGYLLKIRSKTEYEFSLKEKLSKILKKLLVPYLAWSVFYVGFIFFCINNSYKTLVSNIKDTIMLFGCGALWFLPALFFAESIFYLLHYFFYKKYISEQSIKLLSCLLSVGGVLGTLFVTIDMRLAMTILRSFIGLGFLMLGYYVFPMWLELAVPKFLWFILIVVDMIGAWLNGRVDLWGGRIGNVWLYYGCAITGSFLCIKICHLVAAKERRFLYAKIERFFEFIGRNTITVLATHQCCIKLLYKLTERKFYGYLDGVILFFIVIVIEVVIIQFLHRLNSFRQKCDSCNFL